MRSRAIMPTKLREREETNTETRKTKKGSKEGEPGRQFLFRAITDIQRHLNYPLARSPACQKTLIEAETSRVGMLLPIEGQSGLVSTPWPGLSDCLVPGRTRALSESTLVKTCGTRKSQSHGRNWSDGRSLVLCLIAELIRMPNPLGTGSC